VRLEGKRIVVIGGAGLIGSHAVDQLLAEDVAEIVIFDSFVRGTHENLAEAMGDPRVKLFEAGGDIRLSTDRWRSATGVSPSSTSPPWAASRWSRTTAAIP